MAIQLSVATRNAMLDAIETAIGASAIMKIRTGAVPASCATADAGAVVATLNLPADYMRDAHSLGRRKRDNLGHRSGDGGTDNLWHGQRGNRHHRSRCDRARQAVLAGRRQGP